VRLDVNGQLATVTPSYMGFMLVISLWLAGYSRELSEVIVTK